MNKCLIDGRDTENELCKACRHFFEERYKKEPDVLENVLHYFRKHPYKKQEVKK